MVGLASNIIQFIDCGCKVVRIARELRASGQQATESNANASFVTQEMLELSQRVIKDLPSCGLSDDEIALCKLAEACSKLSTKVLLVLKRLEIKGEGGKLEILRAVFRNLRKSELDQLQASLDKYRAQLNVQINNMSRSDILQRLKIVLGNTSMSQKDILYLRDDVQKLQQRLMLDSANLATFFQNLQEVVEIPLRQNAILQRIRYPRMYDRYESVDTAHQGTFEWLLHGPEQHQDSEQQGGLKMSGQCHTPTSTHIKDRDRAKEQKHREFVAWLQGDIEPLSSDATGSDVSSATKRQGSIFHVAGKPGAGKSTLMKFLCENHATFEHLRKWSGGKPVLCAKAFLWRLGDDEQKNLTGLRNCLLHQILQSAPRLIPVAFHSAWESDYTNPIPFDPHGTKAFDTLLRSGRAFEDHKMIFFIDGLDEFMGHPTELIREINSWAARNPMDLKICVSSREWNEFEFGFQGYPSFRIQEWTRDDIETFVLDRFNEICDMSAVINRGDLNPLAKMVVDKAEGVFLWVRVALAALEQGVLNHDEFQDLREKILSFPTELKNLYQYLFDSIPECDRKKAFEAIIFTFYRGGRQSLLQYKFLNDLARKPDLASNMSMEPLSGEELRRHLMDARRQVNGRCKGFLEICPAGKEKHPGDEDVKLMHLTVSEFLLQKKVRENIESYLDEEELLDRVCQSFIAFSKSIDTDAFFHIVDTSSGNDPVTDSERPFVIQLIIIMQIFRCDTTFFGHRRHSLAFKNRFLRFLDNIEQIVSERFQNRLNSGGKLCLLNEVVDERHPGLVLVMFSYLWASPTQLVTVLAAKNLLVEYFEENERCDLRAICADSAYATQVINAAVPSLTEQIYSPRAHRMLELIFQAGISPNVDLKIKSIAGEIINRSDLWSLILRRLLFMVSNQQILLALSREAHLYETGFQYRLIELCLKYGAAENFSLRFGPCYEMIGANRLLVQVAAGNSTGRRTVLDGDFPSDIYVDSDIYGDSDIYVDYHLDIVRYAVGKGGMLTFRDLLEYWFPHDYPYLYTLLDKKGSTSDTIGGTIKFGNTHSVDMPIIFPFKERGFRYFDANGEPAPWERCSMPSERYFEEFEARLKEKGLRPYEPQSTYYDSD